MGQWAIRMLLEWAAQQGTWMWLELNDAVLLKGGGEAAAGGGAAAIGLGLMPAYILFLGGLVLPASKLGKLSVDPGG